MERPAAPTACIARHGGRACDRAARCRVARRVSRAPRYAAAAARARAPRRSRHSRRLEPSARCRKRLARDRRRRLRARPARFRTPTSTSWSCCRPDARRRPRRSSASSRRCGTSASSYRTRCARSTNAKRKWRPTSTIRTSLLEHRFLAGARGLFRAVPPALCRADGRPRVLRRPKALEQQQRHLKYQDADLQPRSRTSRESPGGLRDLATVLWIARAAGFGRTWRELARNGLDDDRRSARVSRQERFIGAMRVRLHYLLGTARGSAGLRCARCARQAARLVRYAREAGERAADAALLPRRESWCGRSTRSCCRTCTRHLYPGGDAAGADRCRVSAGRRIAGHARRAPVRAASRGDARCLSRAAEASAS
mgnify:CR=1 FL=1